VPYVLLSGDFNRIDDWRQEQAEERTKTRRPDIWNKKSELKD
jgi:tRNA (guanine37-N1)-methyltransferase